MVDVTSNATVYPSTNDIAVTEKKGRYLTEQSHKDYVEQWMGNHIVSGFLLPATDPDLTITVPLGVGVINGRRVDINATTDVLLTASSTNHIWLQLSFDGNGDVDGVDMVFNTTGAVVANAVKIGEAVTDATTVTSTYDSRIFHHVNRVSQQFFVTSGFLNQSVNNTTTFTRGPIMRVFVPYQAKFVRIRANLQSLSFGMEARLRADDDDATTKTGNTVNVSPGSQAADFHVDVTNLKRFAGEFLELSFEIRQTTAGGDPSRIDDDGVLTGLTDISPVKFFATNDTGKRD